MDPHRHILSDALMYHENTSGIFQLVYHKEVLHDYFTPNHKKMNWPTQWNKNCAAHDGRVDLTPSLKVNMAFLYSEWLHFLWHGMKRFIFEWSIEKHQKYQRKHLKRPTMVRHSLYTYWPWEVGLLLISIKIKVYVNNIIWLWKMFYSYDACKLTDNMQWTNMEK